MAELLFLLLVAYLVTVALSWGLIRFIYDDILTRYAFVPVFNLILPFLDLDKGRVQRRTGIPTPRTPQQEIERLRTWRDPRLR